MALYFSVMIALLAPGNLGLWMHSWEKSVIQARKGSETAGRWGGILMHPGPLATVGLSGVRSWPLTPMENPLSLPTSCGFLETMRVGESPGP